MSNPPYRALRIVLRVMSLLAAIAGIVLIAAGRPLMLRLFLGPPPAELSVLLHFVMKEMGGLVLTISLLLFLAARDPERNIAVVDAVIAGLCILAVTPLISLRTLEIAALYPGHLIWGRSVLRLIMAGVLFYLRPRPTAAPPADERT